MSVRNPNNYNQMSNSYQSIYQDQKNPFSKFWSFENKRLEFPFLKVSVFIEKAESRLMLHDTDGRSFSFSFLNHGKVLSSPPPNALYLDVGNRFCRGILDHHQWQRKQKDREIIRNHSAASMVYRFPEKMPEVGEGEKLTTIEIYLPKRPGFDAVTATYLAVYYLSKNHFPMGAQFITDYARMQDEGNTPYVDKYPLSTSPSAILYIANAICRKFLLQSKENNNIDNDQIVDNLMLINGLAVLEHLFAEFHRSKLDENATLNNFNNLIHKRFQHKEFKLFTDAIKSDYLKYLDDVKRAETFIVTAQYNDVKGLCKQMRDLVNNPRPQTSKQLLQILKNRIPRLSNPEDELLSETYGWMLKKMVRQEKNQNIQKNLEDSIQKVELIEKLSQLKQKTDSKNSISKTETTYKDINAEMIVLENPESVLFKEWARTDGLHCCKELKKKGFAVIFSIFTGSDIPKGNRFVISVNPRSNITLKSLSQKLQREEQRSRRQTHLIRLGEHNRPGYENPDPWFDGRGTIMEDTIVDTPISGTLINKKRVKQIVFKELKARENIFSGNLCFISKINTDRFAIDGGQKIGTKLDEDKRLDYRRYFYRKFYDFLSPRFLWIDFSKLQETGIKVPRILEEKTEDKDVLVELLGIQIIKGQGASSILSINYSVTSRSGLDVFPFTDNLSSHICKRIDDEINKEIFKTLDGSSEEDDKHLLSFYKIGEGKQFYKTVEMVQETPGAYSEIFLQKSSFSIPQKNQYNEFYLIVQTVAMYAFYLKDYIITIDSEIEEHMRRQPSLKEIKLLRQSLIRFLSQDYLVETASLGRYSEIWKRFLKKFELSKYIEEAKWQCTEISNYYIENQSLKTNLGVAILSWLVAPISIVLGILQLYPQKLKPLVIGSWQIDPTLFWLGSTLLFSLVSYLAFQSLWPFIKKKWTKIREWKNHKFGRAL